MEKQYHHFHQLTNPLMDSISLRYAQTWIIDSALQCHVCYQKGEEDMNILQNLYTVGPAIIHHPEPLNGSNPARTLLAFKTEAKAAEA